MLTITDHELQVIGGVLGRFFTSLQLAPISMAAIAPPSASAATVHPFEVVARRWHEHMTPRWTPAHAKEVLASMERHIFEELGALRLDEITAPVVLAALRTIEEKGSIETARRIRQRISMVFSFAAAEGIASHDPAAIVTRAMTPPAPVCHHAALVTIEEAAELLTAAEDVVAGRSIKLASRFLALTAVRIAPVRLARWSEIEGLDGDGPLWRVPAAHMKLSAAKKKIATNDHIVPLSRQAVAVLRAAMADRKAGDSLIFPGVGESAVGSLYKRAGFNGRHVPHGWRTSFSTIMNERFPADRAAIDMALAHIPKDKVEAAYNRATYLEQRRRIMQAWADLLCGGEVADSTEGDEKGGNAG